jgi:peptidoglycan/xylan/chitin deacetylase (PgdA/CDA1 family)
MAHRPSRIASSRLDRILGRSPAQWYCRKRSDRRLVVLAYHDVTDPERFEAQMDFLRTNMRPVSLGKVLSALEGGSPLPRGAVLVTFDDGDRTLFDVGLPVLRDRGIPAVAFVVAGLLDSHEPFWWVEAARCIEQGGTAPDLPRASPDAAVRAMKALPNPERLETLAHLRRTAAGEPVTMPQLSRDELVELQSNGVAIGNHTWSHPCLDHCDKPLIETELTQAHEDLTETLGGPPECFAYPNGNHDPRAQAVLEDLRYRAAFLFDHRIGPFPPTDPYKMSRIRVSSATHPDRFRILVSGLHSSLHHLLGRP